MKKNTKQFLLLSTLATGCIYGMNQFIDATSEIKKLLSKHNGHVFEWRYGHIFYTKQGNGSPILLIHDLHPASSSHEWDFMIRTLEKDHTVYTIDLLGCGRSDKPNFTYTNYMYVQLLIDFVKKIIRQRADVIATGSSCSFTLMAANMDDSIFHKLFFISPPSLDSLQVSPDRKNSFIKHILGMPLAGTFFYNLQMSELKITELFEQDYYQKKSAISGKLKDIYYESAHAGHSKGRYLLRSIIGNYTNINIIPALKKVENPIFFIGSSESEKWIKIFESYRIYDENIETAYISGCGKLPQLEQPNRLSECISMFYE